MTACGLDFGTSNSGVALVTPHGVRLARVEDDDTSIPSAIFFPAETAEHAMYGRDAMREYLDGTPGRLMRSLKSLLGSRLIHERTAVGDRSLAFTDILTLYLRTLRERSERDADSALSSVVLGRPVRFVDDDGERDADAQATLATCARAAGFRDIEFQLEPIAAAFDYERGIAREEAVLVVDVGGGTADFTVIRVGPGHSSRVDRAADVLANDGIHIAGTDFDTRLHLAWVMPALGYGSTSTKGLAMPSPLYFDLSTWYRINLLYGAATREALRELREFFADETMYARLRKVVQEALGHELLSRTEAAKIALSNAPRATIDLSHVDAGLGRRGGARSPAGAARGTARAPGGDGRGHRPRRGPCAGRDLDRLLHGRVERHDGAARRLRPRVPAEPNHGRRPLRQRRQRPRHRRCAPLRLGSLAPVPAARVARFEVALHPGELGDVGGAAEALLHGTHFEILRNPGCCGSVPRLDEPPARESGERRHGAGEPRLSVVRERRAEGQCVEVGHHRSPRVVTACEER